MDKKETVKYREEAMELAAFIKESPTPFHVTANIGVILEKEGFMPLQESRKWEMKAGGKYYVTRNHSSIIAFEIGEDPADYNFQIAASHSDSPTFKVKENAQMEVRGHYTKLNTEGYGGMLCGPWFDRPLSLAGRAVVKEEGGLKECLVKIDRDLLMIPSLAIHMNRQANEGQSFNKQTDMLPLIAGRVLEEGEVKAEIAGEIGASKEEVAASIEAGAEVESLYRTVNKNDENSILLIDKIEEENSAQEELLNRMVLRELLTELSDKDREIIVRRYYYNETQSQIATRLGISQVQVSRLEKKILKQMREKI